MSLHNQESLNIIYSGPIDRYGYELMSQVCETLTEPYPKKVNLILSTYGGDPDAGFRIARCLQHYFTEGITLFVPHYCKSAGTLIAIGASELVLSDRGELGPLDVQLVKSDEMFERSSGMDITQGFNVLTSQAYEMFNTITVNLKLKSRLSTKLASEAASQIAVGAFAPIFAQIDPLRLGEIQRATEIAFKYGNLLKVKFDNLQEYGVITLISGYPSHAFVIDRKEATTIFKKVRQPDTDEIAWLKNVDGIIKYYIDSPLPHCEIINNSIGSYPENDNEPYNSSDYEPASEGNDNALSDTRRSEKSSSNSKPSKQQDSHRSD